MAGGKGEGNALYQLGDPYGIYVYDDETIYIADAGNSRIMEWKIGARSGQVVAGGNGYGDRTDQLYFPPNVIVDNETYSFIICDHMNRRVVLWPCRGGKSGQTIIEDVQYYGLALDDNGFLYVSDQDKHEVRRWRMGETSGTVVAGGNGVGPRLDQLFYPSNIFVDRNHSIYVSDRENNRVIK